MPKNLIGSFFLSISTDFATIHSWNVSCSPKSPKNP